MRHVEETNTTQQTWVECLLDRSTAFLEGEISPSIHRCCVSPPLYQITLNRQDKARALHNRITEHCRCHS